uniref:BTB/POZ-like protein n=1 Tax=Colletotrichum fructicola (strain Nara gc5) TaxID=1213859 RepID=L2FM81_COLFN
MPAKASGGGKSAVAPSPIVTLTVGREGRLFAAHEDVLFQSPFFEAACRGQFFEAQSKRIALPDEEPEVFSAILEYLYKGTATLGSSRMPSEDPPKPPPTHSHHHRGGRAAPPAPGAYPPTPNSAHTTTSNTTAGSGAPGSDATIYIAACGQHILRDTVIYCAAERYGLEELKRLALRKQGLQSGVDVGTILRSAQYAYAHTPDSDSRLRAHYLALIIRCRKTFKRSGTMQTEMERGGSKLFFDLFVAMCNHLDDVIDHTNARTPKTV